MLRDKQGERASPKGEKVKKMKRINYQQASILVIKKFEEARRINGVIKKDDQFRTLKVMESSGSSKGLTYVGFELEFCSKDGDNYRSIWGAVRYDQLANRFYASLNINHIEEVK